MLRVNYQFLFIRFHYPVHFSKGSNFKIFRFHRRWCWFIGSMSTSTYIIWKLLLFKELAKFCWVFFQPCQRPTWCILYTITLWTLCYWPIQVFPPEPISLNFHFTLRRYQHILLLFSCLDTCLDIGCFRNVIIFIVRSGNKASCLLSLGLPVAMCL